MGLILSSQNEPNDGTAEEDERSRLLFGLDSPSPISTKPNEIEAEMGRIDFFDPTLNDSQKDAIRFALASKDIALIHGPPGVNRSLEGRLHS